MKRPAKNAMQICGICLLLAACGSGSSSTTARGLDSLNDLPENGETLLQGQAVTVDAEIDFDSDEVVLFNLSGTDASSVKLTTEDGEIVEVAILSLRSDVEIDLSAGATTPNILPISEYWSLEDGTYLAIVNTETGRFEHQSIGFWAENLTESTAILGAGAYGFETPHSDIPIGQRAAYVGKSTGYSVDETGVVRVTVSDITLGTDFRRVTIDSRNTEQRIALQPGTVASLPDLDFSGNGPVSGSRFKAVVTSATLSGEASGAFHGPGADEVGGTFQLTGENGAIYIGAFGAD
ncbi:transferrin-binding protein-like solute binding protein [Dinoroseobacter sp. S76]|uniref:transferrin-binding protein-like solute binding protein n=1 Tax=Dinoroseobacter sp. S76 TaxID=3415124 RepID=UPI003C7DE8C3